MIDQYCSRGGSVRFSDQTFNHPEGSNGPEGRPACRQPVQIHDWRTGLVGGWMPWTIIDAPHTIGRAGHGEEEIADSVDPDDD